MARGSRRHYCREITAGKKRGLRSCSRIRAYLYETINTCRGRGHHDRNQFVTDDKGPRVAVQIDLKKHGAIWEDFWDGLVSESRRKEKGIPYEQYRASRLKGSRSSE